MYTGHEMKVKSFFFLENLGTEKSLVKMANNTSLQKAVWMEVMCHAHDSTVSIFQDIHIHILHVKHWKNLSLLASHSATWTCLQNPPTQKSALPHVSPWRFGFSALLASSSSWAASTFPSEVGFSTLSAGFSKLKATSAFLVLTVLSFAVCFSFSWTSCDCFQLEVPSSLAMVGLASPASCFSHLVSDISVVVVGVSQAKDKHTMRMVASATNPGHNILPAAVGLARSSTIHQNENIPYHNTYKASAVKTFSGVNHRLPCIMSFGKSCHCGHARKFTVYI